MLKNIKRYIVIPIAILSLALSFIFGYFTGISQITYSENPIIQYIENPKPFTVENVNMPVTYYGTINGKYIGYQITPHNVNDEARKCFYKYLKLKNEDQEKAKNCLKRGLFLTEYLISQSEEETVNLNGTNITFIIWRYNFDYPEYNLSKGWAGSLCQAGCLKTLYLAYNTTGDERYLILANKALNAFKVPVERGGLLKIRKRNNKTYYWYPEYASNNPPYVLNGFITSVIWIGEFANKTNNKNANFLYREGVKSIKAFISDYDDNDWSYYDALGHRCNKHYEHLHRLQMLWLYNLTKDEIFLKYYNKWKE
ncbi:D-glucuronyl C5-epimerase family protein [Methanotorris igneus]|uniref:D-glucuronyl C5-epimerase domain protein n=1 Tax=Methanotorris igneus (strain DSM 5666 / JCM 11834 / Kol 5) TaxID=880724 RepID=F6BDZ9_METIK|nr:D-glucuronyl C5-epimerase family protein [Methanotorris igneus]AEF96710.1 D-glucuronyl C5-epimerase domain protein [Methanotorris igneus Kol 5]